MVVVSYNSRDELRACVEPLAGLPGVHVVVVDSASADGTLDVVADLPVERVGLEENLGFAHGCNVGWRRGKADSVLFLNPDARIGRDALERLTAVVDAEERIGIVGPRIVDEHGAVDFSQRRFPRPLSTFAQALFLHRVFPSAHWSDELVRDADAYERAGSPDWISGACMLVRRTVLERLGGLDEGFFLYCEDIDLCKRARDAGYDVRFEPAAAALHIGGASAPRASLLPTLAASRIRYARKHRSVLVAALERLGIALGALTHIVVARGGAATRAGHARSLREVVQRNG